MQLLCVICSDLIIPDADLKFTRCGHLFHSNCLEQWNVNQKTCPQCRCGLRDRDKFKVYLNFESNLGNEDPAYLNNKINTLELDLALNKKYLSDAKKDIMEMSSENMDLKSSLSLKDGKLKDMKKQYNYYRDAFGNLERREQHCEKVYQENNKLREKVENLQNVQNLIDVNAHDTEEFINKFEYTIPNFKFVAESHVILKREYELNLKKMQQIKELARNSQKELFMERKSNIMKTEKLSEKIEQLEQQIAYLKEKQEDKDKMSTEDSDELDDEIAEFNIPCPKRVKINAIRLRKLNKAMANRTSAPEGSSSVSLKITSKNTQITIDPSHKHSIFNRAGRLKLASGQNKTSHAYEVYDGMGGHSVPDFQEK